MVKAKVVEPVLKRSKKEAEFCPYCDGELDSLDLMNSSSFCKCGEWWYSFGVPGRSVGEYYYKPNEGGKKK